MSKFIDRYCHTALTSIELDAERKVAGIMLYRLEKLPGNHCRRRGFTLEKQAIPIMILRLQRVWRDISRFEAQELQREEKEIQSR